METGDAGYAARHGAIRRRSLHRTLPFLFNRGHSFTRNRKQHLQSDFRYEQLVLTIVTEVNEVCSPTYTDLNSRRLLLGPAFTVQTSLIAVALWPQTS